MGHHEFPGSLPSAWAGRVDGRTARVAARLIHDIAETHLATLAG